MDSDQNATVQTPRPRHTRSLEHIEIHEDAIFVTQNNPYSSATSLDTALSEVSFRKPLGEIDMKSMQHDTVDQVVNGEGKRSDGVEDIRVVNVVAANVDASHLNTTTQSLLDEHSPLSIPSIFNDKVQSHVDEQSAHLTNDELKQSQTSTIAAASPSLDLKQRTSRTPTEYSHKSAISVSKRQQGQGDRSSTSPLHNIQEFPSPTTVNRSLLYASKPGCHIISSATRSSSNKENLEPAKRMMSNPSTPLRSGSSAYDALEAAVVGAATPPLVLSQSEYTGTENAILALDDLNEAIEQVSKTIPEVPASPTKKGPIKNETVETVETAEMVDIPEHAQAVATPVEASTVTKEAAVSTVRKTPIVRINKTAQARMSLAHGPKDAPRTPAWGPPRQYSVGLGRTSNLRQSFGPAVRSASGSSSASDSSSGETKKEVVIPHSKPRPMSMAFPAPPPPPKSTKAPTRPTFQLPGEAVAAKLKAAREERDKKEDQVKTFKARPVPAAVKNAPVVRQTNTSRARESLGGMVDVSTQHRRASSVAGAGPANKRQSVIFHDNKALPSALVREVQTATRSSTSLANISKPRVASPADVTGKIPAVKGTSKGREVFGRSAFASDAAEREKRAKEDANRKARAEAAERSRQLSREWAEKKRLEKLNAKPGVKA